MQELILVISRCISHKKRVGINPTPFVFHFKGYYEGERINMIYIFTSQSLSKGDDYFLWVRKVRVENKILEAELIKYKKIT